MNRPRKTPAFAGWGLCLLVVCLVALQPRLVAGGKEHPMRGTVTALGTSHDETTAGGTLFTHVHRTYTVKTDSRVFVLECPYDMEALHIAAPSECGGKKKIAIGDTLHFRVEKNKAFVLTPQGKDETLRVVSEAMNEGSGAPTAQP